MKKYTSISAIAALLLALGSFGVARAYITLSENAVTPSSFVNYDFFASTTAPSSDATTTSATSTSIYPYFDTAGRYDAGYMSLAGAKQVAFYFGTVGSSTQSATFYVQVSPDGVNWYPYNTLIQNSATATAPGTSVLSQTVTATSTVIDGMQVGFSSFQAARCVANITAAASATCKASATF